MLQKAWSRPFPQRWRRFSPLQQSIHLGSIIRSLTWPAQSFVGNAVATVRLYACIELVMSQPVGQGRRDQASLKRLAYLAK